MKNVSKLCLLSALILVFSCAPKRVVVMPSYEGVDIREVISSRSGISSIDTTFSISFERDETEMKGDGALNLSKTGDLGMRIYYLGFLAFQMTAEDGVVRSDPAIDKNKRLILVYGLRDSFFWWDLKDFMTDETGEDLILTDGRRMIKMDRKTMLPKSQTIRMEDGRQLEISYAQPQQSGDYWYPSKMRITLSRYAVDVAVKDLSYILANEIR